MITAKCIAHTVGHTSASSRRLAMSKQSGKSGHASQSLKESEIFPFDVLLTGDQTSPLDKPTCLHPPTDGSWGIDTIEVWAHVTPDDYQINQTWKTRASISKAGEPYYTHTLKYEYEGQTITIAINTLGNKCFISLNAAKLVHSDHLSLLAPNNLKNAFFDFLSKIKSFLSPSYIWNKSDPAKPLYTDWDQNVYVSRIDLARNFNIPYPEFRSSLENLPHFGKARHITEKYKKDGWSITQQTKKNGKSMLYNKTAQLLTTKNVPVAPGIYRFETQLRGNRKREAGLTTLAAINNDSAWLALEKHWNATKWGQPTHLSSLYSLIVDKFPKEACQLIGYITMKELGLPPGKDPKTLKTYDLKIAQVIQEAQDGSQVQHLDLFTGTQKTFSQNQNSQGVPVKEPLEDD